MCEIWITLIGITAGAVGFLVATFWFQPILRYRDLKAQILSDLIFFARASYRLLQHLKMQPTTKFQQFYFQQTIAPVGVR